MTKLFVLLEIIQERRRSRWELNKVKFLFFFFPLVSAEYKYVVENVGNLFYWIF